MCLTTKTANCTLETEDATDLVIKFVCARYFDHSRAGSVVKRVPVANLNL